MKYLLLPATSNSSSATVIKAVLLPLEESITQFLFDLLAIQAKTQLEAEENLQRYHCSAATKMWQRRLSLHTVWNDFYPLGSKELEEVGLLDEYNWLRQMNKPYTTTELFCEPPECPDLTNYQVEACNNHWNFWCNLGCVPFHAKLTLTELVNTLAGTESTQRLSLVEICQADATSFSIPFSEEDLGSTLYQVLRNFPEGTTLTITLQQKSVLAQEVEELGLQTTVL